MGKMRHEEPLIDVRLAVPGVVIAIDPARRAIERTAFLRKAVAEKLAAAQEVLPRDFHWIVRDAWRPAFVQAKIFFGFIRMFKCKHPEWSEVRCTEEASKYVAPWKGEWVSGHMTGGAVDVRIVDARGRRIPMRSKKLSYQEDALPEPQGLPRRQATHRKLLRDALISQGFSNMPLEFWHWSYGDRHWAEREKRGEPLYDVVPDWQGMYAERECPCGSGMLFSACHA